MISIQNKDLKHRFSTQDVCNQYGLNRDAYYKFRKRFTQQNKINNQVITLVKHSRKTLPREGTRKLTKSLKTEFYKYDIKIGRDRLFNILRDHNMLIKRKKYSCRTTNSYHRFHKYNNIIKDLEINQPNQVWASDITYIRTINGFCYLALITDMYSRKIVGFDLSNTLELTGCLNALRKAIYNNKNTTGLIHHSDRGIQYCSNVYTNELKRNKMKISMTEENHCYENAMAERVNGILKDEFYLDQTFTSLTQAKRATKNAIKLYNSKRLHLSLDYKTPNSIHLNAA